MKDIITVIGLAILIVALIITRHAEAGTLKEYAAEKEQQYSLEAGLLRNICYVESHWRPDVKGYHGEVGVCQIKPSTVLMFCQSCAVKAESIYQGKKGKTVVLIQTELQKQDYSPGTIDGNFGLRTHNAVTKFQKAKGLLPDGIVGPRTWKQLFGRAMDGPSIAEQLRDPYVNIEYAARYLVWLRDYLKTNDRDILAAAYNGGPANATVVYMLKVRRVQ